jgi:hypothetical protein
MLVHHMINRSLANVPGTLAESYIPYLVLYVILFLYKIAADGSARGASKSVEIFTLPIILISQVIHVVYSK